MIATVRASCEGEGKRLEGAATLTIIENRAGPLTKHLTLSQGRLQKIAAAELVDGLAIRTSANDISQLAGIVERLSGRQALVFGVAKCDSPSVRIVAQAAVAAGRAPVGAICRDRANFAWPAGRTVFMLDIDRPKDGSPPYKARAFDHVLCELLPWWSASARLYRPSASAYVHDDETGDELSGPGSLRCYAIADKGENIPFLGIAVTDALWRAGMGRIEFSASGALLLRSPVDAAVWQPERLDFAGPVTLGPGLRKAKHPPWIIPGTDIDTEAAIARGPGKLTFAAWSSNSLEIRRALHAARPERRRRRLAAIGEGKLDLSTLIHFADGRTVQVAEILKGPGAFDGLRCADPEDPDYANDRRIAVLYENAGWPRIFSHAQGGTIYTLGKART